MSAFNNNTKPYFNKQNKPKLNYKFTPYCRPDLARVVNNDVEFLECVSAHTNNVASKPCTYIVRHHMAAKCECDHSHTAATVTATAAASPVAMNDADRKSVV